MINFNSANHAPAAVPANETREQKITRLIGDYRRTVNKDKDLIDRYINLLKEAGMRSLEIDNYINGKTDLAYDLKRYLAPALLAAEVLARAREAKEATDDEMKGGSVTITPTNTSATRTDEVRETSLPSTSSSTTGATTPTTSTSSTATDEPREAL